MAYGKLYFFGIGGESIDAMCNFLGGWDYESSWKLDRREVEETEWVCDILSVYCFYRDIIVVSEGFLLGIYCTSSSSQERRVVILVIVDMFHP